MNKLEFIKFEDYKKEISQEKLKDTYITVYEFIEVENGDYTIFCGLLPYENQFIQEVLMHYEWDIEIGFGHPSFWKDEKGNIHYERFGYAFKNLPFEPLIICRSFYGLREEYIEISEEFRLYHNLYYDSSKNEYIYIAQSGKEDTVIKIEEADKNIKVKIKTIYLRDFLAAKSMVLVRFHKHRRYLSDDLTDIFGTKTINYEEREKNFCYIITIDPQPGLLLPDVKCISIFLGKDIIPPFKEPIHDNYKSLKGENKEKYEKFIIGIDEKGNEIEFTCNPEKLKENSKAPNYLTPVYFKPEVLRKYYENPSKYSVEDGFIKCGNLWCIFYGINSSGLVHVWLGDLGYLPYEEQKHWRQYNVPPEGGIGETTYKRDLLAEFVEPDEIIHIFKNEFEKFSQIWRSKMGWDLFLPLREEDVHYFKALHIPLSEDPFEFENQILALSKILNDSINVKELKNLIGDSENTKRNGINLLEKVLIDYFNIEEEKVKNMLQPLRDIQRLRSFGIAHRKGSDYEKVAKGLGIYEKSYKDLFEDLLKQIICMLKELQKI